MMVDKIRPDKTLVQNMRVYEMTVVQMKVDKMIIDKRKGKQNDIR